MTRRFFGGRLSVEARQGWNDWAARQGISVTALLEATGRVMAEHQECHPDEMPARSRIIEMARAIDEERRRRSE